MASVDGCQPGYSVGLTDAEGATLMRGRARATPSTSTAAAR